MRRRACTEILVALVVALAATWLVPAGAAARRPAQPVPFRSGHGLTILSVRRLDSRLFALTLRTTALPGVQDLRILLPTGYGRSRRRRYPVLYLLDGTSGLASNWTENGDAERTTAGLPLIVVMPDITIGGNGGGWCTNWPDGRQAWETYHIDQLLPWIGANLRTLPGRGERAIAGLSQGGFCSLSYAARHPDLFGTALGFSPAPDIWWTPDARLGAMFIINATEVGLTQVPPDTFFGSPVTDGINWAAHDPATLAENLRATRMTLYWGTGVPGPLDQGVPNPEAMAIEGAVARDSEDFAARLHALGVPAQLDQYGPGTHSWPYWARDLRWSIGRIMAGFAHPVGVPREIAYTSGENAYSVYGWSVAMHRLARELSTLSRAGRRGFSLTGSGSATVITPRMYRPRRRHRVTIVGPHVARTLWLRATQDGRIRLQVPLGPSNPYAEYTPQAEAFGTHAYTTRVRISSRSRPQAPARGRAPRARRDRRPALR